MIGECGYCPYTLGESVRLHTSECVVDNSSLYLYFPSFFLCLSVPLSISLSLSLSLYVCRLSVCLSVSLSLSLVMLLR